LIFKLKKLSWKNEITKRNFLKWLSIKQYYIKQMKIRAETIFITFQKCYQLCINLKCNTKAVQNCGKYNPNLNNLIQQNYYAAQITAKM